MDGVQGSNTSILKIQSFYLYGGDSYYNTNIWLSSDLDALAKLTINVYVSELQPAERLAPQHGV